MSQVRGPCRREGRPGSALHLGMRRITIAIVSSVVVLAGCAVTTRVIDSGHRLSTVTNGAVQTRVQAPAPSEPSDLGRLNPPIRKGGSPQPPGAPTTVPPVPPELARDRCSTGGYEQGKRPMPECALQ